MMQEAQENTKLLAQPVGMFKNLSPDWGHEQDRKQYQRTNTTVGKENHPNGIAVKQPRVSQDGQDALKAGRLQYKPDIPTEYAKNLNR